MSNNLRTRNGMPFNFVNGLKVRGMDIESLIPGIEGIPEAGSKYQFAGDGSNKGFTLPVTPYNKDAVDVYVKQLYIHPDDYALVGDTITLTEAPPAVVVGETYNVVIKVSLTTLNGYVDASRVSFEGENLDDILEKGKPLANYSNLRAYAGTATQIRITDPGIEGYFYYDATDTTSVDNGGTIIVSGNGKRWKRLFDNAINILWFMSAPQVSDIVSRVGALDVSTAVQQAINYGISVKAKIFAPKGVYRLETQIDVLMPYSGSESFWLDGERGGTVFQINHTGNGFFLNKSNTLLDQGSRLVISNCGFGSATANSIIYNKSAINVKLDGLHFSGVSTTLATIVNEVAYGMRIKDTVWRYCTGDGVRYKAAAGDIEYSFVNSVEDSDFSGQNGNCIYAEGTAGLLLKHTVFQKSMRGILLDSVVNTNYSFNLNMISCWFEQNVTADISAPSSNSYWSELNLQSCHFGFRSATLGGPATLPGRIELGSKSRIIAQGIVFGGATCQIVGSADATALLMGTTNFTQSGTFAWNYFDAAGRFKTPFFEITAQNNIQAAGAFVNEIGTTSVPSDSATTLKTLSTSVYRHTYILSVSVDSGPPASYYSVGLLTTGGLSWRYTALQTASSLTVSLNGAAIKVTQISGVVQNVSWTLTRVS